ncbi:hypothetical protein NEF87_000147 [Candidatus Lokiarchaeum ossiferum]|uniref:Late embryogenesis abundant protein LEA-2 subgroup domain-containing protein n=1 Tax=Candidatus Lokiarchaeum ossiferum TaxID=2951803 RepID=A0ABY6HK11_9ARCH|nr:hypothetical protein NEF87_000147 [Candidatus Lokiarchaeum sp. B-35]
MKVDKKIIIPVIMLFVLGSVYGGSFFGIQSYINSQLENPSEESSMELLDFQIISMGDTFIEVFIDAALTGSTENTPAFEVEIRNFQIIQNDQILAEYTPLSFFSINTGSSHFSFTLNVTIVDQQKLFDSIQSILNKENIYINFEVKVKVKGIAAIYPPFFIKKQFFINSTNLLESGSEETFYNIQFNSIDFDITNLKCAFNFTISITNPVNFSINITGFKGYVDFDDLDGAGFLISSKNDVFLLDFDYNWETEPFTLLPAQNSSKNILFSEDIPDVITSSRISDEYFVKDHLLVDITNGEIGLEIAGYPFTFPFSLENIYIPLNV